MSSDSAILARFYEHQSDFERLRAMAGEDNFISLSPRHVLSNAGSIYFRDHEPTERELPMSKGRWSEYMRTMTDAGIGMVLKGTGKSDESVEFKIDVESISNGDRSKGIYYSPRRLGPLRESLDGFRPTPEMLDSHGGFVVFRQIKPNWYLYLAS